MNARAALLASALFAAPAVVVADVPPAPVCLPPRIDSCASQSKKDAHSRAMTPRLRPALVTMFNVHTREAVVLEPSVAAGEDAVMARLMRDRTNWEEHAIARECLATIRRACTTLGGHRVEIISGFRSDKMNEMLRKKGRHVARSSQHTAGNAVDWRIVGVPTQALIRFVRRYHNGGTGFYPTSGFVHVDAGPRRQWGGE